MTDRAQLLTKDQVAKRWLCSKRTLDRLRLDGKLPWLDLTNGRGCKPLIRFREADILAYEEATRMAPLEKEVGRNASG